MFVIKLIVNSQVQKVCNFSTNISVTAEQYITEVNRINFENRFKKFCSLVQFQDVTEKYSSVLIPLCKDDKGNLSILYTRRSPYLRTHVRQISFPGGAKDLTDKTFEDCALRETEEEIGLSRDKIKIWAKGDFIKPPHTAAIMPIIGIVDNYNPNDLKLNKFEVDEVLVIPIVDLCNEKNIGHTQFKGGYSSPVFVLDNGRIKIWGITGMMTNFFLSSFLPKALFNNKISYILPYKNRS